MHDINTIVEEFAEEFKICVMAFPHMMIQWFLGGELVILTFAGDGYQFTTTTSTSEVSNTEVHGVLYLLLYCCIFPLIAFFTHFKPKRLEFAFVCLILPALIVGWTALGSSNIESEDSRRLAELSSGDDGGTS